MKRLLDFKLIIVTLLFAIIGVALGLFISSRWLHTPSSFKAGDYREYFFSEQTDVIMLGTLWCPICTKTRKFLTEENIQFLEYDVDASEEGKKLAIQLGQTDIVPVLILRDRIIRGFNPDDLKELIHSSRAQHGSVAAEKTVSQR